MAAKAMIARLSRASVAAACLLLQFPTPLSAATPPGGQMLIETPAEPPAIELRPGFVATPAPPPPPGVPRASEPPSGNPLWAIPLASLTATRDRPLFTPSRRPPAPVMPNAPVAVVPMPEASPPPMPETRVTLTLIGTIVNDENGIAVFMDPNSRDAVRLRVGDVVAGWTLDTVRAREVVFKNGDREDTLAIQIPNPAAAIATPDFVPNRPNGEVYN